MMENVKSGSWNWRFASEAVHSELGDHPETLLENGEEVKSNPVRRVVRSGDYFLKFDRRAGGRARSEYQSAQLLEAAKIPVVEYLACGESPHGNCLVTRALPESESVADYHWQTFVRDGNDPGIFINNFALFVRHILESELFHPDFHIGNILYSQTTGHFTLVDAMGVRKATWLDRIFRGYRMQRIPMELRQTRTHYQMIKLISGCGISDPEEFYDRALVREADALWREWPKRRHQILAGYPKFTRKIDGVLHVVNPLRQLEDPMAYEEQEGDPDQLEKLFLSHFFLQLALIPHRRVGGFDRARGKLYIEPIPVRATPVPAGDLQERLNALDIPSELTDWVQDEKRQIRFFNLNRIGSFV